MFFRLSFWCFLVAILICGYLWIFSPMELWVPWEETPDIHHGSCSMWTSEVTLTMYQATRGIIFCDFCHWATAHRGPCASAFQKPPELCHLPTLCNPETPRPFQPCRSLGVANLQVIKKDCRSHTFQFRQKCSRSKLSPIRNFLSGLKTGIEKGKCHHVMIEGIPLPAMMALNLAVGKISERNMLVYSV